jgi:hypothetical protein
MEVKKPMGTSYYTRMEDDGFIGHEGYKGLRVEVSGQHVPCMGHACAEKYVPGDDEVCISYTAIHPMMGEDPNGTELARLSDKFVEILRLQFDDRPDDKENVEKFAGAVLITEEQANKIGEFVWRNRNRNKILIHCFAGVSRSRSTAAAIVTEFQLPYKYTVFNSRVFNLVKRALVDEAMKELEALKARG